eukprot:4321392-Prymnesium_polylepis.1
MRTKLGLLVNQLGSSPRAARALFAECDSTRSGRVERGAFVDVMARRLNYDFAARGALPSSREALEALYERYDLDRSGALAAESFDAALRCKTAGARAARAIGRLREGLVRSGGGYEALREVKSWWEKSQEAAAEAAERRADSTEAAQDERGRISRDLFVEGLCAARNAPAPPAPRA